MRECTGSTGVGGGNKEVALGWWERKEAELGPLKQIKGTREWCGRAQGQVDGLREYWEHWGSGGFR